MSPLLALVLTAAGFTASAAPATTLENMHWLAGCWQLEGQPDGAGEQWSNAAGGTMLGAGRTIRSGRTTSFEFLMLNQKDGETLVLTALPFGRQATEFPAVRTDKDEAVFENAQNDFPQRIIYRRVDDQHLFARIEGALNDPKKSIDFPMHRVACGSISPEQRH